MSTITAADVNKLRKQTGAGMMDCKNALVEAEGNFDKAIELLRKKGQKVAAKRSEREASEGVIIAKTSDDSKTGVLVVLNCETDFVAKNDEFSGFAEDLAKLALNNKPASLDQLKDLPYNGITVGEKITELVGKIGEKIELSQYEVIESDKVVAYNHPGNKLAVIAGYNKAGENVDQAAREVAMQIAAMNPVGLDKDDVDQDVINKEIEIGKEQAREEGKPEDLLEKIAQGRLGKFFKENTLLNQDFVREPKKTVRQVLNETEQGLTVTAFKRASLN